MVNSPSQTTRIVSEGKLVIDLHDLHELEEALENYPEEAESLMAYHPEPYDLASGPLTRAVGPRSIAPLPPLPVADTGYTWHLPSALIGAAAGMALTALLSILMAAIVPDRSPRLVGHGCDGASDLIYAMEEDEFPRCDAIFPVR